MNVSSNLYLYLPYASNAEEQFQHNFGDDGGATVWTPDTSVDGPTECYLAVGTSGYRS